MATFTTAQQTKHRKAFIEECRQKAWGARCQADQIGGEVDKLTEHYKTLQEADAKAQADIEAIDNAPDFHTVENRQKKRAIQAQRDSQAKQMKAIAANAQRGTQILQQLLESADNYLTLAKHAEEWEWKEVAGSGSVDESASS
jgi:hypothetical protein